MKNWFKLAQDEDYWRAFVNSALKFLVLQVMGYLVSYLMTTHIMKIANISEMYC